MALNKEDIVASLLEEYAKSEKCPHRQVDSCLVYSFLNNSRKLLTLDYLVKDYQREDASFLLDKIEEKLLLIFEQSGFTKEESREKTNHFLSRLPALRSLLTGSMNAILNGDPASNSIEQVVTCYPGFQAILNYRIAHELYLLSLPLVARIITEEAHRSTGIDINPGATIGENLFIDHGTGIVIGETAIIGNNVKLYQGVTLGARSLSKGRMLVGTKRHPTVEDDVTIYSNASILGGDTIIGKNSTIGANVYLISSVEENSIVYLGNSGICIKKKNENQ